MTSKMVLYRWVGPYRADAVLNPLQTEIVSKFPKHAGVLWSVSQYAEWCGYSRAATRRAFEGLVKLGMVERWAGGYKPLSKTVTRNMLSPDYPG